MLISSLACHDATSPGASGPPSPCPTVAQANTLAILGCGVDTTRFSAEIAVHNGIAYTTTWGQRAAQGNKINIWDVSTNVPTLIDSLIAPNAINTGDVAVSDDGTLLVVATEFSPGSIRIYSLADPRHPQLLSVFSTDATTAGVHTAEIGRVNGTLYAFLCVDLGSAPSHVVIVDLSDPTTPKQVFTKNVGNPFVHDTFLRDGLLFVAAWNDGLQIWDVGGGGAGGTPASPVVLGSVKTVNGETHNVWWYHDATGGKRFAFVGEEVPSTVGSTSGGDIHVVDVSDFTRPKEVAFFHVNGAGTHNFSVDEANGVLYAAYYNGGVRAIDVTGDLSLAGCPASQTSFDVGSQLMRCDLSNRQIAVGLLDQAKPVYVWGVQYVAGKVYASDMLNGIWALKSAR